ncbi:aKG-HExxH-type peptide beta-hydroxylase [Streptomyces sp. URMC 126]|uniref:aKG-HExxH-type peptide beta-hydroxylase n=1 Tax=Streptomyces sp. URMC 126 TaxID=3423401 RepID=UPI003F1DF165
MPLIREVPRVLRWGGAEDVTGRAHAEYEELVGERLGRLLARLRETDPRREAEVVARLARLDERALPRVLLAPETTRRLLWPGTVGTDGDTAEFLIRSSCAESALDGAGRDVPGPLWTALGDAHVRAGGEPVRGPSVRGVAALDLDSPYALGIDVQGAGFTARERHTPLAGRERREALAKVTAAVDGIGAVSGEVLAFTERFTKVLVLLRDDAEPVFSSGSCGQYVGRSVLGNPQAPAVDEVLVAEGLVHESIHGLLYMLELRDTWARDDRLFDTTPAIASPWTGRPLPVRPFLQASFVWYGLLHFWSLADRAGVFPADRVRERREVAARGFLGDALPRLLAPYRDILDENVAETVEAMRELVTAGA